MPKISTPNGPLTYLRIGEKGPGMIMIHGAMQSALSHRDLAVSLSTSTPPFSVYLYSRRGRASNPTFPETYSMTTELSDLTALMSHTGVHYIAGISAGALICLQAALKLPDLVRKVVIYEPILSIAGSVDDSWVPRYEAEMTEDRLDKAMTTAMLGTQMGPGFLSYLPRWVLEGMTRWMINAEKRHVAKKQEEIDNPGSVTKSSNDELKKSDLSDEDRSIHTAESLVSFSSIAPTLSNDVKLVKETALLSTEALSIYASIRAKVLLMGGKKSPAYLKLPLPLIEDVIPGARLYWFNSLGHEATGNKEMRGNPDTVAGEMVGFFGENAS